MSVVITAIARSTRSSSASPRLIAVATVPAPSGLVSTSASPGAAAGVGEDRVGVHGAGHREAVLGLGVVDRVPADDARARRGDRVGAAAQDLRQHLGPERLERERDEVERGHRHAAHRVDVRQRVGGRDAPERVRVVDDRGEEVGGLHERQLVAELHDAGVVGGVGRDEHARVASAAAGRPRSARRSAADSLQPQPAPCEREVRAGGMPLL